MYESSAAPQGSPATPAAAPPSPHAAAPPSVAVRAATVEAAGNWGYSLVVEVIAVFFAAWGVLAPPFFLLALVFWLISRLNRRWIAIDPSTRSIRVASWFSWMTWLARRIPFEQANPSYVRHVTHIKYMRNGSFMGYGQKERWLVKVGPGDGVVLTEAEYEGASREVALWMHTSIGGRATEEDLRQARSSLRRRGIVRAVVNLLSLPIVIVAAAASRHFSALAAPVALALLVAAGARFATSMSVPASVPTPPGFSRGPGLLVAAAMYVGALLALAALFVVSMLILHPPRRHQRMMPAYRPTASSFALPAPLPTVLRPGTNEVSLLTRLRLQGWDGTREPAPAAPGRWSLRSTNGYRFTYYDRNPYSTEPWRMVRVHRAHLFIRGPAGALLDDLASRLAMVSEYGREQRIRDVMQSLRLRVTSSNASETIGALRNQSYVVRVVESESFGCSPRRSLASENDLLVIEGPMDCGPSGQREVDAVTRSLFAE
jgi:hypothetical protein